MPAQCRGLDTSVCRLAFQKARLPRLFSNASRELSALLARYGSYLDVFPTTIPVRRITASGALRCTPGSVANPLNSSGLFIASFVTAGVCRLETKIMHQCICSQCVCGNIYAFYFAYVHASHALPGLQHVSEGWDLCRRRPCHRRVQWYFNKSAARLFVGKAGSYRYLQAQKNPPRRVFCAAIEPSGRTCPTRTHARGC